MRGEPNGSKAERERLRREMQDEGCTSQQIADEMARRWGFRPRQAWRHVYGWTQEEVCIRYNKITGDPNAPMTAKRISDYETWPIGGVKPTLSTLTVLAQVYGTQSWSLVDFRDREHLTQPERIALRAYSPPLPVAQRGDQDEHLAQASSQVPLHPSGSATLSLRQPGPIESSQTFVIDPDYELSPRRLHNLIKNAAYQSKDHAETAREHGMPETLLEDVTAEVEHLTREHLNADSPRLFAETVQARNKIYRLLERRQYPGQTSHLYYLASVTCALLADSSMGFGMPQAALEQTRAVWAYAEIIGHNSLRLWARVTQASLAHADGRPQRALELAQSAEEWATEPLGKTGFYAVAALYSAATGRTSEARSALSLAFNAYESATGDSELFDALGGMFSYPAARLFCVSTMTHLDLKDGEHAESHATQALAAYEAAPAEERPYGNIASARIDLAHARLLKDDIDGVMDALSLALRVPPEQRLDWVVERLKDFYQSFQGHEVASSSLGRQLVEEIEDFCGVTAADQYPNIGR